MLHQLANKRFLGSKQIQSTSPMLSELLQNWLQAGWLHIRSTDK
jgi:hypothetical protein